MQTSQSGQERQREVWRVHKLESILSTFLNWGTSLVQYIVEFSITNVTLEARFLFVRPSTATTTAGSQANIRLRASQEEGTGQKSHRFIFFFKSMIGVSVVQGIYAILGRREGVGSGQGIACEWKGECEELTQSQNDRVINRMSHGCCETLRSVV